MNLVAIMPIRSEDWIIGLSARVALKWCDAIVIGLHACTDGSADIVAVLASEYGERVIGYDLAGEAWDEMGHRQQLLLVARGAGASHVAIVDADEMLTGNLLTDIRSAIDAMPTNHIMQLPGYNLRGGLDRYHANGVWGNRWFSCVFRDSPELHWGGDRFHHREPMGRYLQPYRPFAHGSGGVMHLWGASERRLRAKSALYKATEALRWPAKPVAEIDQMYSWAIKGGPPYETADQWRYADVPAAWWAPYDNLLHYLRFEADPWQEAELQRLVAEHAAQRFAGLDLFGVERTAVTA